MSDFSASFSRFNSNPYINNFGLGVTQLDNSRLMNGDHRYS